MSRPDSSGCLSYQALGLRERQWDRAKGSFLAPSLLSIPDQLRFLRGMWLLRVTPRSGGHSDTPSRAISKMSRLDGKWL